MMKILEIPVTNVLVKQHRRTKMILNQIITNITRIDVIMCAAITVDMNGVNVF